MKIGSSQPIFMTEEECGRKCFDMVLLSDLEMCNSFASLKLVVHARLLPEFLFRHTFAMQMRATFPSGEGLRLRR